MPFPVTAHAEGPHNQATPARHFEPARAHAIASTGVIHLPFDAAKVGGCEANQIKAKSMASRSHLAVSHRDAALFAGQQAEQRSAGRRRSVAVPDGFDREERTVAIPRDGRILNQDRSFIVVWRLNHSTPPTLRNGSPNRRCRARVRRDRFDA